MTLWILTSLSSSVAADTASCKEVKNKTHCEADNDSRGSYLSIPALLFIYQYCQYFQLFLLVGFSMHIRCCS